MCNHIYTATLAYFIKSNLDTLDLHERGNNNNNNNNNLF